MKETEACDAVWGGNCWDYLMTVLQSTHPTGLSDSLRLTRVAEDYYRRMNGNIKHNGRSSGR